MELDYYLDIFSNLFYNFNKSVILNWTIPLSHVLYDLCYMIWQSYQMCQQ